MGIEVKRYSQPDQSVWDIFVDNADNGFFFFKRAFMEYHADRFTDFSLLIYFNNHLVSLFPANLKGNQIHSHQGLSYGGLIYVHDLPLDTISDIHNSIQDYFHQLGISSITVSPAPPQYSESRKNRYNDLLKNKSVKTEHSKPISIVDKDCVKLPTRRRLRIPQSHEEKYRIIQVHDFKQVWPMIAECYINQHGFQPVHSTEEMLYLKSCFPDNIIANAIQENSPNAPTIATLITLEDKNIVKFQYIGYTKEARNFNVIDFLYYKVIQKAIYENKSVDMGHSIDVNTNIINENIIFAKRRHGAIEIEANTFVL